MLVDILCQLAQEEVYEPIDLQGLCVKEVKGFDSWSPDIILYMENLCTVELQNKLKASMKCYLVYEGVDKPKNTRGENIHRAYSDLRRRTGHKETMHRLRRETMPSANDTNRGKQCEPVASARFTRRQFAK